MNLARIIRQKKPLLLSTGFLGLTVAIAAFVIYAKDHALTGTPKNAALAITLDQKDSNTLVIYLKNVSRGELYIFNAVGLDESDTLGVSIKNLGTGESYEAWLRSDPMPPPPRSKDAFMRLLPGETCQVEVELDQQLKKPGKYELRGLYESPIDSKSPLAFGLPMWGHERGIIASAPIEVTIH